jgi:6-phosphogluconolactonase/glucosamine-6-phosphate isomerase/deaminase
MYFNQGAIHEAAATVAQTIAARLAKHDTVLWLVSGGSAIPVQIMSMQLLAQDVPDLLKNLTILPVDERYGCAGHADSNSEQMRLAGFASGATQWFDILAHGGTPRQTLEHYKKVAEDSFAQANTAIATFGLGVDGHTAGILPDSPAANDTTSLVVNYPWTDYERMTLGLVSLRRIDIAFVLAYGETKCAALHRLQENKESLSKLPAKILYDIPDVTVYNDCIKS